MGKNFEKLVHNYEKYAALHDCENIIGRLFYYSSTFDAQDILALWADREDATLEFPFGGYRGIEGVKRYYLDVMGDRSDAAQYENLRGVMCVSLLENEIVQVAEDGRTARGVWLSPGIETYGRSVRFEECTGRGFWTYGKVAADFILEEGQWKLWHLRWYLVFRTEYHNDWVLPHEYLGNILKDPACDYPPRTPVLQYDIDAVMDDGFEIPEPYETFSEVAPGYGYEQEVG